MFDFLLTAGNYAAVVFVIAAIGGVLRLRYLKRRQRQDVDLSSGVDSSVDACMDNLHIEDPGSMVSVHALSKRGSWRVALDQVMPAQTFEQMKAEEYSKKL